MKRRAIPKTERHIIYRKCDGRCCYCGKKIDFKEMQVDHYFPFSMALYYSHVIIDDTVNLMPACRSCNHYKRGDTPRAFKDKIKTLHTKLGKLYIGRVAVDFGVLNFVPFDGLFYFESNPQFGVIYPSDIYEDKKTTAL